MEKARNIFYTVALAGIVSVIMAITSMAAVRGTDVSTPADNYQIVGIEGTFYRLSPETVLDKINQIRYEACEEGVWNPSNPSQKLTIADYVPIKWSAGLEEIAQTRAAEADVYRAHVRPNGSSCFTLVASNGTRSWGEVLAWNWSSKTDAIPQGIDQWYEEKEDWVNRTGAVTGHYTQMIDPKNTYVGIGCFLVKAQDRWVTVSGEFSSLASAGASGPEGVSGDYTQMMEVPQERLSLDMSSQNVHVGNEVQMNLKLNYDPEEGDVTEAVLPENVTWSSSNPAIVEIPSNGIARGISVGTVDITASVYNLSASAKVTSGHIWNSSYTVDIPATCTQTGSESIHCSLCSQIKEGSARTIAMTAHKWSSWTIVRAATDTSKGTRTRACLVCGTKETQKFTNDMSVKLSKTKFTYTGKRVHPSIKYVKSGSKKLSSSQYKVTYKNDKGIGYAQVIVTGKGTYAGMQSSVQYRINPPKEKITSLKAQKGCITVKWKKVAPSDGYIISISEKASFKSASVTTVNKSKISSTKIQNLASGKQLYVRVRTFKKVNGKKWYGAWSGKKKVKVK